jgi:hypothetical protein
VVIGIGVEWSGAERSGAKAVGWTGAFIVYDEIAL